MFKNPSKTFAAIVVFLDTYLCCRFWLFEYHITGYQGGGRLYGLANN